MTKSTDTAIRNIRELCDEAFDHNMSWAQFLALLKTRIEVESEFVRIEEIFPYEKYTPKN